MGDRGGRVGGGCDLAGDVLRSGQVEPVGEHREDTEEALLVIREEVVGPFDGGAQCPVVLVDMGARGQNVQGSVQPAVEIGEAERRQPSRGQLDGERHAVQPAYHLGDGGGLSVGREARAHPSRPLHEEGDGWHAGEILDLVGGGQCQRCDRADLFER